MRKDHINRTNHDRRRLIKQSSYLLGWRILTVVAPSLFLLPKPALALTPSCQSRTSAQTPEQAPGPFYTPGSPLKNDLREKGMAGQAMQISGHVLNQQCEPIAHAMLDFWHADSQGVYDNQGYRLRGHLLTDAAGRYNLTTVLPGLYPGRTSHIHVIAQGQQLGHQTRALTTQLYFPDQAANQNDYGYDPRLELQALADGSQIQQQFGFDFILQALS